MTDNFSSPAKTDTRTQLARLFVLLLVVGLTLYIYAVRDEAQQLERYGYPGLFVLNAMASATVLLPAPGIAVVFAFGGVFNPFWVAMVAGLGATVGELSAYAAGYSGRAVIEACIHVERRQPD
ncbi:MAG: DedA family protein, partial [Anaerolineales bacterium]